MQADLLMIPHESTLLTMGCEHISLGSFVRHRPWEGFCPQVSWCVLCWWLQQGMREDMAWSEAVDFHVLSCGSFRKPVRNLLETAQRKSQTTDISTVFMIV